MKKIKKYIKIIRTKIEDYLFDKKIKKLLKDGPKYTYTQIIYK